MKLVVIVLVLTFCASICAQHPSPCPEVFQYDTTRNENGKWFGELTLDSEFPLSGVWIRIVLDRKIELLGTTFTDVATTDNKEYVIKNREYSLVPGQPLKLSFFVKYSPLEPIPSFVSVRLNGRTVCPAKPLVGVSQCPGVFNFNQDKFDENRWFGTLNLDSELELKGVWIRIILDTPAELLGNEFGEIKTTDNLSYLIKNRDYVLTPGRPLRLPFWVKFSALGRKPNVQSVRLNGRTVCGQYADVNQNNVILVPQQTRSVIGKQNNDVHMPTTTELDVSQNSYISCGTVVPESLELIVRGERSYHAQWPWHGAIYLIKPAGLEYICGMSLISESHALTAAHCVIESITTKKLRDPRSLILYFGLINRKDFTASHVQRPQASRLIMHPNYTVSENDIAVIKFDKPVKFTDWVRPVCLWEDEIDMRYIVNRTGTVVGFGVTETGKISNELLYANILVVDTPTCIYSYRDFYAKYTSFNTYCAGNLTQSAVCNGDSGGAMVFKRDGSDIWQMRGIVSTAVRNADTGLCDYNHYAIFTDAAKYRDWIEMTLTL